MGTSLDPENIKEGDDVYFECHINANPDVQRVLWYKNVSLSSFENGKKVHIYVFLNFVADSSYIKKVKKRCVLRCMHNFDFVSDSQEI